MATVTGLTAERMQEIEGASVIDGEVVGGHLILTKHDGTPIDAGNVEGPPGPAGPPGTGSGVDYIGDWAAGITYKPGDVVRHNGVDYLAVNPSTGQAPPSANPFVALPRSCRARQGVAQSIPDMAAAGTALIFDAVDDWDTDGLHNPAVNNTRITIPAGLAGLWRFDIFWSLPNPGAAHNIISWLKKNGVQVALGGNAGSGNYGIGNAVYNACSIIDKAAVGDYYEAMATQQTGAARNVVAAHFTATYQGATP